MLALIIRNNRSFANDKLYVQSQGFTVECYLQEIQLSIVGEPSVIAKYYFRDTFGLEGALVDTEILAWQQAIDLCLDQNLNWYNKVRRERISLVK